MTEKLVRYKELKEQLKVYQKRPTGDRIKPGGLLEQRIKIVFNKERAEKILKRSEGFTLSDFEEWEKIRREYYTLKRELEESGIITYNEEGEEIITVS